MTRRYPVYVSVMNRSPTPIPFHTHPPALHIQALGGRRDSVGINQAHVSAQEMAAAAAQERVVRRLTTGHATTVVPPAATKPRAPPREHETALSSLPSKDIATSPAVALSQPVELDEGVSQDLPSSIPSGGPGTHIHFPTTAATSFPNITTDGAMMDLADDGGAVEGKLAQLQLLATQVQSRCRSHAGAQACFETLTTLLDNLLRHPGDERVRVFLGPPTWRCSCAPLE